MRTLTSAQSKNVQMHNKSILIFSSNSYLDLSNDSRVKEVAGNAIAKWGVGSGGSRLATGNTTLHENLEIRLAAF